MDGNAGSSIAERSANSGQTKPQVAARLVAQPSQLSTRVSVQPSE